MTITEANAVNVLLDALYKDGGVDESKVDAAAMTLATNAYKALGAGWTAQQIDAHV